MKFSELKPMDIIYIPFAGTNCQYYLVSYEKKFIPLNNTEGPLEEDYGEYIDGLFGVELVGNLSLFKDNLDIKEFLDSIKEK